MFYSAAGSAESIKSQVANSHYTTQTEGGRPVVKENWKGFYQNNGHTVGVVQVC